MTDASDPKKTPSVPRTDEELNPATMLIRSLAKKFRHTEAVREALEVVRDHIAFRGLRNGEGDLIISDDWYGEKGVKTVAFLASFSELAHDAAKAAPDKENVATVLRRKKANDDIRGAMELMTEYLDRGMSPGQLKQFFKGYQVNGAEGKNNPDPTRLKLIDHDSYLSFPTFEVKDKAPGSKVNKPVSVTLMDLVETAGLTMDVHLKSETHAQKVSKETRGGSVER